MTRHGDGKLLLRGERSVIQDIPDKLLEEWRAVPVPEGLLVSAQRRGGLKRELTRLGMPVWDEAGYRDGEALSIGLREELAGGRPFQLRGYQREAADRFCQ